MRLPLFFTRSLLRLSRLKLGRILMLSHGAEQGDEVAARLRCFGVARSKGLLTNCQRASIPVYHHMFYDRESLFLVS